MLEPLFLRDGRLPHGLWIIFKNNPPGRWGVLLALSAGGIEPSRPTHLLTAPLRPALLAILLPLTATIAHPFPAPLKEFLSPVELICIQ